MSPKKSSSSSKADILFSADENDALDFDGSSMLSESAIKYRQIYLCDNLDDSAYEEFKRAYDKLTDMDSVKPIHIVIGSAGGSVFSALGIINTILLSKTPIYTYVLNRAWSCGAWIYLAGHKRFAPNTGLTSFMLHPFSWTNDGGYNDQKAFIDNVTVLQHNLVVFAQSRTKIPESILQGISDSKNHYFTGEELFSNGIATDVLESLDFHLPAVKKKKAVVKD